MSAWQDGLNLADFEKVVSAFAEKVIPQKLVAVHKKLGLAALRGVVQRTPVDVGQARGNWQLAVNAVPTGEIIDARGRDPVREGAAALSSLPPFSVIWLANNAEHAAVLELGLFDPPDPGPSKDPRKGRKGRVLVKGGYSTQAPRGMVRITFAELEEALR